MKVLLVLAVTLWVLMAFGVACGDDDKSAPVPSSPAGESEGGAEEWEAEEVEEAAEEGGDEETEDGDGDGDGAEADDDGIADEDDDGVPDADDNCPNDPNPGQEDLDDDGLGVPCDGDNDGDGIIDMHDNCPLTPNPDQEDWDGDHEGNACDDIDHDGFFDADEADVGSDPLEDASVPESDIVNPGSCTDTVDNDGDALIDLDDDSCGIIMAD